jgi:thymidylate synthase ThyX
MSGQPIPGEYPMPADYAREKAVQKWADAAMYRAEPMPEGGRMTVRLLNATEDPLGVIAALCGMYAGRISRHLSEVTDDQRRAALADMLATELNGPLSAVQFVFLIEGVDRSFTHQAVRQQFAFIAQESLRFAVKEDWSDDIPLPPSLAGRADDDPLVRIWRKNLQSTEDAYAALVHGGMPAEEARGLLPEAILTRYYWSVNLKGLLIEAGKRTCTQAQFHWRRFFALVAQALREWGRNAGNYWYTKEEVSRPERWYGGAQSQQWQFDLIADQLRPHCYQSGSCGFMAKFDRGCKIRDRVEQNANLGRPSSDWHLPAVGIDFGAPGQIGKVVVEAIDPLEWAADPGAART